MLDDTDNKCKTDKDDEIQVVTLSINHEGESYYVEVDTDLGRQIMTDSETRKKFMDEMVSQNKTNHKPIRTSIVKTNQSNAVWSSRIPTDRDQEATKYFLELRKKYGSQFNDRKHIKVNIWNQICEDLNEAGYFVGTGKEGAEKCRQKFANLQRNYTNHLSQLRRSDDGKRNPPPYYEDLHEILKDKFNMRHSQDPMDASDETGHLNSDDADDIIQISRQRLKSRISPKKRGGREYSQTEQILQIIREQQKEDSEQIKHHLELLQKVFVRQAEQRDRLLNILESTIHKGNGTKRRRSSSSSD